MRRREVIAGLAGAATWPLIARAQQPRAFRIGVLLYSTPSGDPSVLAFKRGMAAVGYVEGRNLNIEYRFAEGRAERLASLARELVELRPDVIVAFGGDVAPSAVAATKIMPIVFASSADPVAGRLVASLGRPGGNATGVTFVQDDLGAKRLELLKEAVPQVSSVAFFWNPEHLDNEYAGAARAAQAHGMSLRRFDVRDTTELGAAFQDAAAAKFDALYVVSSRQMVANIVAFATFAAKSGAPLVGGWGAWAKEGALLSYGPNVGEMVARTAVFVDKILKGTNPAELPVEQPTKFDLVVNLGVAKSLGLKIPESFLARADEVIE